MTTPRSLPFVSKWRARAEKLSGIKKDLLDRDPYCYYCEERLEWATATLDHYQPISAGGADESWNLVLACRPCNAKKADKVPTKALHEL